MLSRELSNRVANFGADRVVSLVGQALQQLAADGVALRCLEGQEEIDRLPRSILAGLGRLAPEDHSGEGSGLQAGQHSHWSCHAAP